MKRVVLGAFVVVAACAVSLGCMDREPTPVCPVPTEVTTAESMVAGFDGVDLLVVVDNSKSMLEEQAILATGFFTLINSLVKPTSDWSYPPVANMRVAVVSSDMGLQYGPDGIADESPTTISNCGSSGDDGEFQTILSNVTNIPVGSGLIGCEEDGDQCPEGFTCESGVCNASADPFYVDCPSSPAGGSDYAETSADTLNSDLATEVSCMSALGTDGCGIEQQLQAAARALERPGQGLETDEQAGFLKSSHLLAVLVVSDEEDCSIEDPGLFTTPEWQSGSLYQNDDPSTGHLNTACNFPASNDIDYLWDPEVYYDQFIALKGNPGAVIFAAIAGVPRNEDSDAICEGLGDEIGDCLGSDEMQLEENLYEHPEAPGQFFYGFSPACERVDPDTGDDITTARPGRRYVNLAEKFGGNSYMYSICNEDWGPAMENIAKVIAEAIGAQCYPKPLEWARVTEEEGGGCEGCGAAKCDMLAIVSSMPDVTEFPSCPEGLIEIVEAQEVVNGTYKTYCEVPKIPTPLYCDQFAAEDITEPGWYYCENLNQENFDEACQDNVDNDGVGGVDCADPSCAECPSCNDGEIGPSCQQGTCTYAVELTAAAKELTRGLSISIQCLQQFNFEDENCQENSNLACNNEKDDDGNGVWDCADGEDHFADPNCCPLVMDGTSCHPAASYADICPGEPVMDTDQDSRTVCESAAFAAGCTLTNN